MDRIDRSIIFRKGENMKTKIKEMDRGVYDIKNEFSYSHITDAGINKEIVREISKKKNEPDWILERRLKSLDLFYKINNPVWGPDLSILDFDKIIAYVRPKKGLVTNWDDVPEDVRNTFDSLGIPEAEKTSLAGVGAQYDSEEVYHSLQQELVDQGVIYTDFDRAIKEYPDLIKKYFQKAIPPTLHKYAALHGALFSGGSFVYVPKNVKVEVPLQSYYRLNAPGAGQFEHTMLVLEEGASLHFIEGCSAPKYDVINVHAGSVEIFVAKNASLRFSTIENWSRNMYNLNTKRAIVEENGRMEWISGSFGSKVSMLYPASILVGENASTEFTQVSYAGEGQELDTGAQVFHLAKNTKSTMNSKSISSGNGKSTFRSVVRASENAVNSKSSVDCESLMIDNNSISDTIPVIDLKTDKIDVGHEAKIGRIDEASIFYLQTRGISEEEARAMIVRGFAEPVAKELPIEYAVEMNNLINMELEGANG